MSKKLQKIENHLALHFTGHDHGYQLFSRIPTSTTSNKTKQQDSSYFKKTHEFTIPLRNEKLVESLSKKVYTEPDSRDFTTKNPSTLKNLNARGLTNKSKDFNFPDIFSRPQTATSTDSFLKIRKIGIHQSSNEVERKPAKYFRSQKLLSKPEKHSTTNFLSTTAQLLSNETQQTDPFDQRRSPLNNTYGQRFTEDTQQQTEPKTNESLVQLEKNLSTSPDQQKADAKFFEMPAEKEETSRLTNINVPTPGQRPNTATYPKEIKEKQYEGDTQSFRSIRSGDLVDKLVDMQIVRNNQKIAEEKIQLVKSNSSVHAHLQTLTTASSARSSARLLSPHSLRPGSSTSLKFTKSQMHIVPKFKFHRKAEIEHHLTSEETLPEDKDVASQEYLVPSRSHVATSVGMREKRSKLQTPGAFTRASLVSLDRSSVASKSKTRKALGSRASNSRKSKTDKGGEIVGSRTSIQASIILDNLKQQQEQEQLELEVDDAKVVQEDLDHSKKKNTF